MHSFSRAVLFVCSAESIFTEFGISTESKRFYFQKGAISLKEVGGVAIIRLISRRQYNIMKFGAIRCNSREQAVITELEKELGSFIEKDDQKTLQIEEWNKEGYGITVSENVLKLTYHRLPELCRGLLFLLGDRKSTRLNSSH